MPHSVFTLPAVLTHLRYSARTFGRTPAVTTALLLTIAVGVGGNAAVHGFARGLIARDTPAAVNNRVFSLVARDAARAVGQVSSEDYHWLAANVDAFEWVGAVRELRSNVELAERFDIMSVAAVTPPIAALFDLSLADGAIISHEVWNSWFDAKPDVRGVRLRIDGREVVVRGVAPASLDGLHGGRPIDIWMPLPDTVLQATDRNGRSLWVLGRLRDDASVSQAEDAVRARPVGSGEVALVRYTGLLPELAEGLTRLHTLLVLAAGGVLLMVGANLAAFFLGRSAARSHETAIRIALGARRGQLVARLLSDAVFIAIPGAALGVVFAYWTSQVVPALLVDTDAAAMVFRPDVTGMVATAVAGTVAMIACGLAPLLRTRFDRPEAVLRRGSAGTTASNRLHAGLVVAQVAICCALVITTGLLQEAFRGEVRAEAGQRLGRSVLVTVQSHMEGTGYFRDVERSADSTADASTAVWVARPPGLRPSWQTLRIERPDSSFEEVTLDVESFTPATLDRVVLPPIAGRMFGGRDMPDACRVALVNQVAAEQVFDGDAVGTAIVDPTGQRVQIVGVVATRERLRPTIFYYADQTRTPFDSIGPARFRIPATRSRETVALDANVVSSGYFDGIGARVVAGHAFDPVPAPNDCRVAVVDWQVAERHFGGAAIGGAIIDHTGRRADIIGVVRTEALGRFERRTDPTIYFHMEQAPARRMTLMLGARESDDSTLKVLRGRLAKVMGGIARPTVERLDEHLGRTSLAPLRIALSLLRAAAVLAITLALVGIYGALAEAVRRRRREIGVRLALGARGWRVVGRVLGHACSLVGAGVVAGALAVVAARSVLLGTAPSGAPVAWHMWLAGPLVMLAAVAVASVVPVVLALRVDPLDVLRDES